MLLPKSISCSRVTVAILSLTILTGQNAQLQRVPDVPYLPTTEEAVVAMLKLADVKSTDVVYDLGCGDGRIVVAAAKQRMAHGVGIDIDPVRIRESRMNAKMAAVEQLVRFELNDAFEA